ncbi:c-type cytochrome [Actimicrobium sp. CCI2.3]|uniref:c-type cytochrome n=1 Tax=Actimicrobium sp. CCI2.3 TaxID=3048616 RepID=UPI002AB5B493|nr:c-type cytochrome [Actimicrobium sp. CCI2.3]MDY7573152.1 c-type cytochrome [Actimicrobium sp. CCI2.3]MEB0022131.1 c-type cytochrome [Actimicrobium sp. CCI2.3]
MSDSHDEHSSGIKTPKQLIAAVVAGFIVPIIGIVLLVQYVSNANKVGDGSEALTPQAISARIRPVADEGFTFKDVNAIKVLQSGEAVYKGACMACHAAGVAGAPKVGDTAAWSARIAQGYDTLVTHAVNGIRGMPAKGGNADLDNIEVARAVAYMANQAGATFKEPDAPAAAATPTADAAAPAPAAMAAPAATPATPAEPVKLAADTGKKIYDSVCMACHAAGIAGSPKFGDKLAWAERIKQGPAVLHEHAIKGYQGKAGMMPAKGGSSASDDEVKAAVDYMIAAAK